MKKSPITSFNFAAFVLAAAVYIFIMPQQAMAQKQNFSVATRWHRQAQFAGIYMAKEKGFYEKENIETTLIPHINNTDTSDMLINKTCDIAVLWFLDAVKLSEKGHQLVNIAQINQKPSLLFITRTSSAINSLEDFSGRKISLWPDITPYLTAYFKEKKITPQILSQASRPNLFLRNIAEAAIVSYYNEYHYILNTGTASEDLKVFPLKDYGLGLLEDGLYMTKENFYKNPSAACRFAAATIEGWRYAAENRSETINTVLKAMKSAYIPASRSHQTWMLKTFASNMENEKGEITGTLEKEDFEDSLAKLKKYLKLKKPPKFTEFKIDCNEYLKK